MNLELSNPFETDYPEVIETSILKESTQKHAMCCAFNRKGTLMAIGYGDTTCGIWDLATRNTVRLFEKGHSHHLTSVNWSGDGRRICSSSYDKRICLWDVFSGNLIASHMFKTGVIFAQMHPKLHDMCVAIVIGMPPMLVDIVKNETRALLITPPEISCRKKCLANAVVFSKNGDNVYIGNDEGTIFSCDTQTLQVTNVLKSKTRAKVLGFQLSQNGKFLLVNSSDNTLFIVNTDTWELDVNVFQDVVNNTSWAMSGFSHDADYVVGASNLNGSHLYLWHRSFGELVKILDGPMEGIVDLKWHPMKPYVACCTDFGNVYLWSKNYTENWSAFAPDFEELEDNEIYEEREDEFDIIEEEAQQAQHESNQNVDLYTISASLLEKDLVENELVYLPTFPEAYL